MDHDHPERYQGHQVSGAGAEQSSMTHGLRGYWNGCKCFLCRLEWANYTTMRRRERHGLTTVPAERSRQLLLQFDTAKEASTATGVSYALCTRIRRLAVKTVRKSIEARILAIAERKGHAISRGKVA